jgi:hypothetical protein
MGLRRFVEIASSLDLSGIIVMIDKMKSHRNALRSAFKYVVRSNWAPHTEAETGQLNDNTKYVQGIILFVKTINVF